MKVVRKRFFHFIPAKKGMYVICLVLGTKCIKLTSNNAYEIIIARNIETTQCIVYIQMRIIDFYTLR